VVCYATPNQYSRAATSCWSVCAGADIIGKPDGFSKIKKSHLSDISTPCWPRKCSSSSFLPRTHSTFQQARRRVLSRAVLLGRAAILGHEEDYGLNLLKPSSFFTYHQVLTFKNSTWRSLCVECFVRISEQTANFALYIID
jgi:hypothetical protein